MTALIYYLESDNIVLATDSLVTDPDLKPLKYCTKIYPLLHLNGVMCVTGSLQLSQAWFSYVQELIIAKDMIYLNDIAPKVLPGMLETINNVCGQTTSSTIYHFGYDEELNKLRGFAFRSDNKFVSEELIASIGFKPQNKDLEGKFFKILEKESVPNAFVQLMEEQKKFVEQSELNNNEKVGIGGDVHIFVMNKKGEMSFKKYHRFADYMQMYEEMLINLKE